MKKILLLLMAAMICCQLPAQKLKANKDTERFVYEIECAGNGAQGTYLVKVWSYSTSKKVAKEQCAKNALHGVIFKGFSGGDGCVSQRAMANYPGAEVEHKDYFERFFADNGEYRKYISVVNGTEEIVKLSATKYKVGVKVTVYKDELRKALEAAGVIRGLSSGF